MGHRLLPPQVSATEIQYQSHTPQEGGAPVCASVSARAARCSRALGHVPRHILSRRLIQRVLRRRPARGRVNDELFLSARLAGNETPAQLFRAGITCEWDRVKCS